MGKWVSKLKALNKAILFKHKEYLKLKMMGDFLTSWMCSTWFDWISEIRSVQRLAQLNIILSKVKVSLISNIQNFHQE